jgi:hypothetical protein
MLALQTKVRVTEDGILEVRVPATALPPGAHEAVVVAGAPGRPGPRFRVAPRAYQGNASCPVLASRKNRATSATMR